MDFKEYCATLVNQKTELIKAIEKETKCSYLTAYSIVNGNRTPRKGIQPIIARIIGMPVEDLFPETWRTIK